MTFKDCIYLYGKNICTKRDCRCFVTDMPVDMCGWFKAKNMTCKDCKNFNSEILPVMRWKDDDGNMVVSEYGRCIKPYCDYSDYVLPNAKICRFFKEKQNDL